MDNQLAPRIRQLRKERGLSQEALANLLDVSRQAVTKWEDGSSLPSTANLLALSALFGIPLAELTDTPEGCAAVAAPSMPKQNVSSRVRSVKKAAWCILIPCAAVLFLALCQYLTAAPPVPEGETLIGYADGATSIFVTGSFPTVLFLSALGGFAAALCILIGLWWKCRKGDALDS